MLLRILQCDALHSENKVGLNFDSATFGKSFRFLRTQQKPRNLTLLSKGRYMLSRLVNCLCGKVFFFEKVCLHFRENSFLRGLSLLIIIVLQLKE